MAKKKRSLYFSDRKRYYRNRVYYQERKLALKFAQEFKIKRRRKIKEQIIIQEPEEIKEIRRFRTQLCFNSEYYISIRAIYIGKIEQEKLEEAIDSFLSSNEYLLRIPFDTQGTEETFIDDKEDISLIKNHIYIEINIRGDVELIKWN